MKTTIPLEFNKAGLSWRLHWDRSCNKRLKEKTRWHFDREGKSYRMVSAYESLQLRFSISPWLATRLNWVQTQSSSIWLDSISLTNSCEELETTLMTITAKRARDRSLPEMLWMKLRPLLALALDESSQVSRRIHEQKEQSPISMKECSKTQPLI